MTKLEPVRACVIYKKSIYENYFVARRFNAAHKEFTFINRKKKHFKQAHDHHYQTLAYLENTLRKHNVVYKTIWRGALSDLKSFNLIIACGGDGTFLEAARYTDNQLLLGVNSDPNTSVGKLCLANQQNFEKTLQQLLLKKAEYYRVYRLRLKFSHLKDSFLATNDILFAHTNPAAITRYALCINNQSEEHRSSGIWVSSALGSTGALYSAGGKIIAWDQKKFSYQTRELYHGLNARYKMNGATLTENDQMMITSYIRNGAFYIDGAHQTIKAPYGTKLKISLSKKPLKLMKP